MLGSVGGVEGGDPDACLPGCGVRGAGGRAGQGVAYNNFSTARRRVGGVKIKRVTASDVHAITSVLTSLRKLCLYWYLMLT